MYISHTSGCLYDLATPEPLNWTRPELTHIEGRRHRDDPGTAKAPPGAHQAAEGGTPLPPKAD